MKKERIEYKASPDIRSFITEIGRTEDIKLSPDNNRMAIAGFLSNKVYLFTIRIRNIDEDGGSPQIEIQDHATLSSDSFQHPHGITFLDNNHIVVCNRAGNVCLFKLPVSGGSGKEYKLEPQMVINGKGMLLAKVKTPGSVDCYKSGHNVYRILVCNNNWHFVSSHEIRLDRSIKIKNRGTLIQKLLKLPDGVSISHDRAWIAVSNHVDGEILIYANTPELDKSTPPAGVLKGIVCPHGVRFTPCDSKVLVADAGSQYLHVFSKEAGSWEGERYPVKSLRTVDDDIFKKGHYNPREGGIKGIDIDTSGRVLVATHGLDVLGFYDLKSLLSKEEIADHNELLMLSRARDESFRGPAGKRLRNKWSFKSRVLSSRMGPILRKFLNAH